MMYPLSYLILVGFVFFFLVNLARGLSVLLILFPKEQDFDFIDFLYWFSVLNFIDFALFFKKYHLEFYLMVWCFIYLLIKKIFIYLFGCAAS